LGKQFPEIEAPQKGTSHVNAGTAYCERDDRFDGIDTVGTNKILHHGCRWFRREDGQRRRNRFLGTLRSCWNVLSLEEHVKDAPTVRLTLAELRILRHIVADGLSSRTIASTTMGSMHAIAIHRKSMMIKSVLGVLLGSSTIPQEWA
jgi:hypothetical protein